MRTGLLVLLIAAFLVCEALVAQAQGAALPVPLPQLPDIRVTAFAVSVDGEVVRGKAVVNNTGNADVTTPFNITATLFRDGGSVEVDRVSVDRLERELPSETGKGFVYEFSFAKSLLPCYRAGGIMLLPAVLVYADPNNVIPEIDDRLNNQKFVSFSRNDLEQCPMSDLAIVNVAAEPVAPNSPETLFKVTVKNIGNNVATCYQFSMGSAGDGKPVKFFYFLPDMVPGASVTKEWSHIYEPGTYTANFLVGGRTSRDPADTVDCATFFPRDNNGALVLDDADLSNNKASKTVTMVQTGAPDLAIVDVSTSSVPTPAGVEVSFEVTVKNVGTFGTYDYRFGCDFGDGTACFAFTLGDVSIAPGGVRVEEYKHVYKKPGTYTAVFEVGTKVDADLSNNELSKTFNVSFDFDIDLEAVGVSYKPADPVAGEEMLFSFSLKNNGPNDVVGYAYKVDFGDGTPEISKTIAAEKLPPGKLRVISLNHKFASKGAHNVRFNVVNVREEDGFVDVNGANNEVVSSVDVVNPSEKPVDLAVKAINTKALLDIGSAIRKLYQIDVTVSNNGDYEAAASLKVDFGNGQSKTLALFFVPPKSSVTQKLLTAYGAGSYTVKAKVSAEGKIDADPSNNAMTAAVTVSGKSPAFEVPGRVPSAKAVAPVKVIK